MGCPHCGLYFVDILSPFATGTAGFINNIRFINMRQFHFINKVDADKPVGAFVSRTIGILG